MNRLSISLFCLALVLFMLPVSAQAEIVDGMGFYARPSTQAELSIDPPEWVFFPAFQEPPLAPAQEDIVLTDQDPLTILVPLFGHLPMQGYFGTDWSLQGDTLRINAYFLMTAMTETIYGPHEYRCMIGQLPAGTYNVVASFFRWGTREWDPVLADQFLGDPAAFAAAHGVTVFEAPVPTSWQIPVPPLDPGNGDAGTASDYGTISQNHMTFTVIPEPTTLAVILTGIAAFLRRRR